MVYDVERERKKERTNYSGRSFTKLRWRVLTLTFLMEHSSMRQRGKEEDSKAPFLFLFSRSNNFTKAFKGRPDASPARSAKP